MSAKSPGSQTSRKASDVEVPATQNLTVLWPKISKTSMDSVKHITSYHHGKIPLEKNLHLFIYHNFHDFQKVPLTDEILTFSEKLPSKSSSFRAVEWQTSTSP